MHVTAIIAAGGRGLRVGASQPKQLLMVGGRPILERSVTAFVSHPAIDAVVVALPAELVDAPPAYLRSAELLSPSLESTTVQKASAPQPRQKPVRLVSGGERRQDSVANAFRAADAKSDVIVIHDAARPFASADLIARTIAVAAEGGAALAAVPARDTVKRASAHATSRALTDQGAVLVGSRRTVIDTLPRDTIYLAQTPQAFRRDVLAAALAVASDATDEATLAEQAGHVVHIVDGETTNIKITTAEDLQIAEAIARSIDGTKPARTGRAGAGYDLHRLVEGRALVIGGVAIPSERGALGHSDADVVCHAITDAILGAACLGDIGRHFPDTDTRWKGVSSIDLLQRAAALVAAQGLQVGNVDVTVILERPKIKDHIDAMRARVAAALGVGIERVSIKGKTNEGMDAIGRGDAIAAHAIALVRSA
ncbi:MAG TPA: 2-C-methyl-D-erythritol 2,4-cyclodiphosphate synthase [Vicinamibacterales bacterium]|nr:2-C-methyl-D-erythritol 2,4-cyclodiphosphate synthase [Vicinamibacterales bacterium]